jgi:CubicO group peptidase (beta-lactamase class C family)
VIDGVAQARALVEDAIGHRIFPAAVVDVGDSGGSLWTEAFGTLTFAAPARPTPRDAVFDLASLTKPIATTTVILGQIRAGRLSVDSRIATLLSEWRGPDREAVTIRDLLEHASGLAARLVDRPPEGRREFEHDICTMPLECAPRTRAIYSDLGFILLGFIAADLGGASLDALFSHAVDGLLGEVSLDRSSLGFLPDHRSADRIAPTWPMDEDVRRGRLLVGDVHDDYAALLGGVAGHAGLFGTAAGVGAFARFVLSAARGHDSAHAPLPASAVHASVALSATPGSSRALGWDTMLVTSSCGSSMSPAAFGHTGFTGTSLWIDPARDRYFVLLTNRVCGGGNLDQMRDVRRAFHDAFANTPGADDTVRTGTAR